MNTKLQLLTAKETAQRLRISKSLVYQLIDEGRLEHVRIGGRGRRGKILVTDEAVEAFLLSCNGDIDD
jgi:excisionase family DNA binding protein